MKVLVLVLSVMFLCLYLFSFGEENPHILTRMGIFLHKLFRKLLGNYIGEGEVRSYFARVSNQARIEEETNRYYINKFEKILKFLFVTLVLSILILLADERDEQLENNSIKREEYQGEAKNVTLIGNVDKRDYQIELEVGPKEYDEALINEIFTQFKEDIDRFILGKNETLDDVTEKLNLCDEYEGYPFTVTWNSYPENIVASDGEILIFKDKCEVTLSALVEYPATNFEETIEVKILLRATGENDEAFLRKNLQDYITGLERESRREDFIILPEVFEDKQIDWKIKKDKYIYIIPLLLFLLSFSVFFFEDMDLMKRGKRDKDILSKQFPNVVYKLLLYTGAGMSIRGALFRLAGEGNDEYKKMNSRSRSDKKKETGETDANIYKKIEYICREIENGLPEAAAYELLGKWTGCKEYMQLGSVLAQNLRKGNKHLQSRLLSEVNGAYNEELLKVKSLGEEATTKLLLPMVIMLLLVMVIIMLPAFWGIAV